MKNQAKVVLETKRLKAIIPNKKSLDNRYKLLSDPDIVKFLSGKTQTKQQVRDYLDQHIKHYQKHGLCLFDIYTKDSNEFMGDAGLIYAGLNDKNKNIEVGYRLLKEHWGKGYATEITKAFLDWGFNKVHLDKIFAYINPKNAASHNVAKKCNMKYVGKCKYPSGTQPECDFYYLQNNT